MMLVCFCGCRLTSFYIKNQVIKKLMNVMFFCFLFSSEDPLIAPPSFYALLGSRLRHISHLQRQYGPCSILNCHNDSGGTLCCVHFSDLTSPICPCRFFAQRNFLKTSWNLLLLLLLLLLFLLRQWRRKRSAVSAVAALFVYRSLVLVCHHSPVFTAQGPRQGRVIAIAFIKL